jgi:hypothetical protein
MSDVIKSRDVLRVLGLYGPVEWARISLGADPIDNLTRPPLVVWRFDKSSVNEALIGVIESTVARFDGRERWMLRAMGRNMAILPQALNAQFREHPQESDAVVMARVKTSDPSFCMRATFDLETLFRDLETAASVQ